MSNNFSVTHNEQIIHQFTESRMPARLRRFMDEMDRDMQAGLQLAEQWIEQPSEQQKQQYVALVLFEGLEKKDTNLVNLMSCYLMDRFNTITEIRVTQQAEIFNLLIIYK